MGKDPAFLFYPGSWLGGTMGMTFEQKGCYLELLMMQFNNGKFTESQAKQVLSVCFDNAWRVIKDKFETDGEYYWNTRLQEEIEKRRNFIESRRSSGLTPKNKKAHAKRTLKRGINKDINEDIIKNIVDLYNQSSFAKVEKLTDLRKSHLQSRINDYSVEKVINVFLRASKSDFLNGKNNNRWKANFDWIVNPNNFVKIMEGNYDNRVEKLVMP